MRVGLSWSQGGSGCLGKAFWWNPSGTHQTECLSTQSVPLLPSAPAAVSQSERLSHVPETGGCEAAEF